MSLATKNVATVLVGCVLVLALSFAFVAPAKADMLSDLQAQVQALLAQIAALSGGSSTGGSGAGCYTFTRNHQMGDQGGEVMWIQKFLNSHGATVAASGAGSVGNESDYFGAKTKAAVAAWQAANGVAPAAGFWGPMTRAKVASVCATTGTPTTPGTPTTGGETLNGTAGTATISNTTEDVEDEVLTGQTEKVLGFKVEASGSDVRVTNVRVRFDKDDSTGSASDYLTNYFTEISIWANGTKIGSMPASSFTRDAAGIYSASIPVSQVVRMGSSNKVTFHVGATAVTSVDSDDIADTNDWNVDATQVRYTDAQGAVLFENPASTVVNEDVEVNRLSNSSDVTLRMGEGSGNPKAGNVKVSESNSSEVTLAEFTLKAEGTSMTFDTLNLATTTSGAQTGTMVQTFFLYRGSTRLAEVDGDASDLIFSLDDVESIAMGETKTYRVVAKVGSIATTSGAAGFDNGDTLKVDITNNTAGINAKAADGKAVTERSGSVTTYTQALYSEGVTVSKVGESFTHNPNSTTAGNSTGEFKVTLRVTNIGSDDVYIPLGTPTATSTYVGGFTSGVAYSVSNGTNSTSTGATATLTRVSGGTELTNSVRISGGSSADFQLTVTFNPDAGAGSTQQWRVQVYGVGHAPTDSATATKVVNTIPTEDFRTSYYTVNN